VVIVDIEHNWFGGEDLPDSPVQDDMPGRDFAALSGEAGDDSDIRMLRKCADWRQ
jgi:hypothetical protein